MGELPAVITCTEECIYSSVMLYLDRETKDSWMFEGKDKSTT